MTVEDHTTVTIDLEKVVAIQLNQHSLCSVYGPINLSTLYFGNKSNIYDY